MGLPCPCSLGWCDRSIDLRWDECAKVVSVQKHEAKPMAMVTLNDSTLAREASPRLAPLCTCGAASEPHSGAVVCDLTKLDPLFVSFSSSACRKSERISTCRPRRAGGAQAARAPHMGGACAAHGWRVGGERGRHDGRHVSGRNWNDDQLRNNYKEWAPPNSPQVACALTR